MTIDATTDALLADLAAEAPPPPPMRFDTRAEALRFDESDAASAFSAMFADEVDGPAPSATRLIGGFSSASFVVTSASRRVVVRFFSGGREGGARELAVLRRVAEAGIAVPAVLSVATRADHVVAALSLCPGHTLEAALPAVGEATFEALGAELARVHAIAQPRAGFLDATGTPTLGPRDGGAMLRDYVASAPKTRVGARLGAPLADAVAQLARAEWHRVDEEDRGPRLIHGDFNPKNLLITAASRPERGAVTLLDWEFALAGHPLIDWGNAARFEADYPPGALEAMARGYRAAGGQLGDAWREAARLADLAALCSFLDREEEHPRTFATARSLIARTVRALGG
jgi:aminoglycoside phosphotransferase (APT) family kinase protein